MTADDVVELKVSNQKIEMDGALKVPAGRDLATTETETATHDTKFGVAVVTHLGLDTGEEETVNFAARLEIESGGSENVAEFRVKVDRNEHISFVGTKVDSVKTANRAPEDVGNIGVLAVILSAVRGPDAESGKRAFQYF